MFFARAAYFLKEWFFFSGLTPPQFLPLPIFQWIPWSKSLKSLLFFLAWGRISPRSSENYLLLECLPYFLEPFSLHSQVLKFPISLLPRFAIPFWVLNSTLCFSFFLSWRSGGELIRVAALPVQVSVASSVIKTCSRSPLIQQGEDFWKLIEKVEESLNNLNCRPWLCRFNLRNSYLWSKHICVLGKILPGILWIIFVLSL